MRRWWPVPVAVIVVAGAAAGVLWARRGQGASTALQVYTVQRGNISATVTCTGEVYAPRQAALSFDVTRIPLIELKVSPGQRVKAGDVLAGIDPTSLQRAVDQAQAELRAILRARHGLIGNQSDDFTVRNQTQIVEMVEQSAQTFTILLGSIAAISLVVGGIGIMNIMFVSVTERTREIGIRKAVGAKRRDILAQFLAEATVLSLLGGVVGVLVGYAGAQIVTPLLGGTRALVTPQSVVLALGVSIAVGLFFGIYPAARAAALHPIEALRYE
jgi:putative ABC transport system permease protein